MMYGWPPAVIEALDLADIARYSSRSSDGGGLSHAEACRRVRDYRRHKALGITT